MNKSNACTIVSSPQKGYYLNDSHFDQSVKRNLHDTSAREDGLIFSQSRVKSDCSTCISFTTANFSAYFRNLLPFQNNLLVLSVSFLISSIFAYLFLYLANFRVRGVGFNILLFLQRMMSPSTAKDDCFKRHLNQFVSLVRPLLMVNSAPHSKSLGAARLRKKSSAERVAA